MDKNLDEHCIIMQDMIDDNRQDSDDKMKKQDYNIDKLTAMVKNIMDHIKISTFSPDKMN